MQTFLAENRTEIINRCIVKVSKRQSRAATPAQLANGVPLFLRQLEATLIAETEGRKQDSVHMSGSSGGDNSISTIGNSAAAHGEQLFKLGYTFDQVVHDYGDICQAITTLAFEREIPFGVDEFRTLNRCLDNAIADAVSAYAAGRDAGITKLHEAAENKRTGFLAHELRNFLNTAMLAFSAIEHGALLLTGSTGAVLRRSLHGMKDLIDNSINDVRTQSAQASQQQTISLAEFIAEASEASKLLAESYGCSFNVFEVGPPLALRIDRDRVQAALANVLQNAFKFTRSNTGVALSAYAYGDRIHIDVRDHCGGLPHGDAELLFEPFTQGNDNKSGVGLGLSIARQAAEDNDGTLTVKDVPGTGCVFTFSFPLYLIESA